MSSGDNKARIAKTLFQKGTEAMAKENWDYAIDMFTDCVKLFPDNLLFRQTLRGVEYRKYGNNKTGAKMGSMRLMPIRGRIKKARMKSDWPTIDQTAEEGLKVNPWDAQLNADMAESCENQGYLDTAIYGYQRAVESEPENVAYLKALGLLLEQKADYNTAIQCWERVLKLEPLNGEARSKIGALRADSVIKVGRYDEAEKAHEVKRGYEERVSGPRPNEVAGPGMSEEADLQRATRKEPNNADNYVKLANYYKREGEFEKAIAQFQKALDISGDPNLREQMEDIELDMLRRNFALAREAAAKDEANTQAAENAKALDRELVLREIDVFSRRIQRYPGNTKMKFDLGERLMRVKKYAQSIPLFQAAVSDPRVASEALVNLGECFLHEKQNKLAFRQFEKALPTINVNDHPDVYKRCHYVLGRLNEQDGNTEQAEHHYSEILAVDYDYKDVRTRLEKLQGGDGGESKAAV